MSWREELVCREEEEGIKRGRGEGKRGSEGEEGREGPGKKAGVVETEAMQISSNSHFDSALHQ